MTINGYESPPPFKRDSARQRIIQESPGTELIIPTQNFPYEKKWENRIIVFLEKEQTRKNSYQISGAEICINDVVINKIIVNKLTDDFEGFENVPQKSWNSAAQALQSNKRRIEAAEWIGKRKKLVQDQKLKENVKKELLKLFDGELPREVQNTLNLYCSEVDLPRNQTAESIAQSLLRSYEEELSRPN